MDLKLDEAITAFAEAVGSAGDVTVTGLGTRGGPVDGVRSVSAPAGIDWVEPTEMTMRCGAATPVADIAVALADVGQYVAVAPTGTIGGSLAVGHSGLRRLGDGPARDVLLQTHYVSAAGEVVKAGGPTVKNVSGFDLCRLMVGAHGTLGFLADVILRTRPLPVHSQWFTSAADPWALLQRLYRPTSVLWNGHTTWVLLEGQPADIDRTSAEAGLVRAAGPPELPTHRWSLPPSHLTQLRAEPPGSFVAEVGVGVVHHSRPAPVSRPDAPTAELHRRIKTEFDPHGRLNPGRAVLPGT
jgi:FAD/FMN-containing dehydrogenase